MDQPSHNRPGIASRSGLAAALVLMLAAAVWIAAAPAPQSNSQTQTQTQPQTDEHEDLAALIRFGVKQPPAKQAGTVRLATYNLENLFDDQDDPALTGRNEDREMTTPEARLKALSRTIHRLNADILCVEEIESLQALEWFADAYLGDMGYTNIISIDAGDARGIEQAVLSRYPVVHVKNWPAKPLGGVHPEKYGNNKNWYAGEPITFHRSPLQVDVAVPGDQGQIMLTLFVVHQKSGRYSGYWRLAEAKGLAAIIKPLLTENPDRPIAVLGDFNTQADTEPIAVLEGVGLTDLFDGAGGPPSRSITHESKRRIDLILASKGMASLVEPGSAFVLGTIARPQGMDWHQPPPPGYASDHYPVAVDLRAGEPSAGVSAGP